ncbi:MULTISPECIES: hypothetical protein [Burkholderiaceae]|uniref:hypothetical protein n=1 Tax=Burkholderiaceae TaxID=119060 RepID=UPI0009667FA1|nr:MULTISPECIES: hypothetical protein [Burkholderiaceae]MCF2133990.1 hypothetical protein [Mycetohabitans sp. B3]MCG1018723.1 hypothetical protein [Mycetohabitans sp. B4]MCG1039434.1 hypothetical protein [Mycetohabitans sp. B7]SIT69677.1 hypothetical protein SAMN04487769_1543 [Burkholderia sp. b14]SIT75119.1 hypothetical protein SAMN04487768_3140 [Burkholderia sp. b13]
MKRLAHLFPLRAFGRLRYLRGLVPCGASSRPATLFGPVMGDATPAQHPTALVDNDVAHVMQTHIILPSGLPAFARSPLRHGVPQAEPTRRRPLRKDDPVRVYRSASRVVLVGHIDAVCSMIDQYIAAEETGVAPSLLD